MYQDFRILAIEADIKKKSITIECNFDIDPETLSEIELLDRNTRNTVGLRSEVKGKVISLVLTDWPSPNSEYIISIQKLKTVLGDELASGIRRKIIFKSSICSTVKVTYPAYDEVITDLKAAWIESVPDASLSKVDSFYVEISTEIGFHNIRKKLEIVGRSELDLTELPDGQYYIRVRAQKDGEYGTWSEVVTFVVGDSPAKPGPIFDPQDPSDEQPDIDDIYTPVIKIISMPEDGVTPTSILIEFDQEIDPDSIDDIIIIRRSI